MGISKRHDAWNRAIRKKFYSTASSGIPVYLDLDDEVFEEFNYLKADSTKSAKASLLEAVLDDLDFGAGNKDVLGDITHASRLWFLRIRDNPAHTETEAPPMLGFLAVSVMAAERMGASTSSTAQWGPNAYYPHLCNLFGLQSGSPEAKRLQQSFQADYLKLWGWLNSWLYESEGKFGHPTAYAISHPYVGAAMSQALVRDIDRRKLPNLFASYNLEANATLEPDQIAPYVDHAVDHKLHGLTSAFRDLWKRDSARSGLAQVLVAELAKWDGSHTLGEKESRIAINSQRVQMVAKITSRLGEPRINFLLSIAYRMPPSNMNLFLNGHSEQPLEWHQSGDRVEIPLTATNRATSKDLFESRLTISSDASENWSYTPSFLLVFERTEDGNQWQQVPKISLGQRSIIALKRDLGHEPKLLTYLNTFAKPGFTYEAIKGSPEGWILVRDVELVTLPTGLNDNLRILEPAETSVVRFEGGIKLPTPGTSRRWLRGHAPIMRLISPSENQLKFEVFTKNTDGEYVKTGESPTSTSRELNLDLNAFAQEDGDYAIAAYAAGTLVREMLFKIGSWRSPDLMAIRRAPLVAHQSEPNDAYTFATKASACDSPFEPTNVSGLWSVFKDEYAPVEAMSFGKVAIWNEGIHTEGNADEKVSTLLAVPLEPASSDSCVFVGNHRWKLDAVPSGREFWTIRRVSGKCERCGSSGFFPATHKDAAHKKSDFARQTAPATKATQPRTTVANPPSQNPIDWQAAIELVRACVSGSYPWLIESLASIATDDWAPKQIVAELEALGHIELISKDLRRPHSWVLSPPHIVVREARLDLIGNWPIEVAQMKGLPKLTNPLAVASFSVGQIETLDEALKATGVNYGVSAGSEFSECLPALSEVRQSAPRSELPAHDNIHWFDLASRRWVPVEVVLKQGAYRFDTKLGRKYAFVDENFSIDRRVVYGSASMVKWFAVNLDEGETAIPYQYRAARRQFALAQGMTLFGLYSRALHAESGSPAIVNREKSTLVYNAVSGQTASNLQTALLS